MSQQTFSADLAPDKPMMNVGEAFQIYDTVLIGGYANTQKPNTGYFLSYALLGANSEVSFFNVRNRSHGIPYNNQDARDQLPYVMHIYSIGVAWFSPSTSCYQTADPPTTEETIPNVFFKTEVPKHTSVILRTNQDERLITTSVMTPPGYGPVGGGIGTGDLDSTRTYPNVYHASITQGESALVNTWGFKKPLQIPRTANLSVVLRFNTYCQNMLQQFTGPFYQPMRDVAADTSLYGARGCAGIQVFLRGKREVQQRGQYHA